jgi:hypothetical protein
LLRKIVAHYQGADSKIKDLAKELFALLDVAGEPRKAAKLKEPAKPESAIEQLEAVPSMLDETNNATGLGWLIDPPRMPGPNTIPCLPAKPVTDPTIEELLKP